jgi:hypothetical protein
VQAGPELVHIQPLTGLHASTTGVNQKNTDINTYLVLEGYVAGSGNSSRSGSGKPIAIRNHLFMSER